MKTTISYSLVVVCMVALLAIAPCNAAEQLRFHIDNQGVLHISDDAARSWQALDHYLNLENASGLRYHIDSKQRIHYSPDGGRSWAILGLKAENNDKSVDENSAFVGEPLEPYTYPLFFHITGDGTAWISLDGGREWVREENMDREGHSSPAPEVPAPGSTMLRFQPHPLEGSAAAILTVQEENLVALTLYDFNGRKVAVLAEGIFAAGEHRFPIETSALQRGVYSYSLQVGDTYEQGAVTVAR